jgi:hypothetical protein
MESIEMDILNKVGSFFAFCAFLWCTSLHADDHKSRNISETRHDLRRLMTPSVAERASEERGSVHIYDSMEINEVNAAMDRHFDRIQNMMFTRIHHLPSGAGAAAEAEVENDGCD